MPRRSNRNDLARHIERTTALVHDQVAVVADPALETHQLLQVACDQVVLLTLGDSPIGF